MVKVFIDFDGTVTRRDVGDAMFEQFGGQSSTEAVQQYLQEKISAVECFRRECEACGEVDKPELDKFLDSQEIDSTFPEFIDYCNAQTFECRIVSDGMDYYIERILNRKGLGTIPIFSNRLDLRPVDGLSKVRFSPSFPFTDEICDRCACCKRNHLLSLSSDEDIIVYIGEGYSDRCPARHADVVFAKDDLREYCRKENISYHEYRTFSDVKQRLQQLQEKSGTRAHRVGLRKRRQAELGRREVFMGG